MVMNHGFMTEIVLSQVKATLNVESLLPMNRFQLRWFGHVCRIKIDRYLGFADVSVSAKTADFIGLSRC